MKITTMEKIYNYAADKGLCFSDALRLSHDYLGKSVATKIQELMIMIDNFRKQLDEIGRSYLRYKEVLSLNKINFDKNEKLKMGPIWDFNLAFGNVNYCGGGETNVWAYKFNERCSNDFCQIPFWRDRLLTGPVFVVQLKGRWQ